MSFSFHFRDTGFTRICAHRGYSARYPENTMEALEQGRLAGASTFEIDVVLTADDEVILLHDRLLDRTTTGHGFAADHTLSQIRGLATLGPGQMVNPGVAVPTLGEAMAWAARHEVGLVIEIKEKERVARIGQLIIEQIAAAQAFHRCQVISFDHVVLAQLQRTEPRLRTEAICHARHVDLVRVLRDCGAESVSIELNMFHPDDAEALHKAGMACRLSVPVPEKLALYWVHGRDPRRDIVAWLKGGLIDSLSGDDVAFSRHLITEANGDAKHATASQHDPSSAPHDPDSSIPFRT